MLAADGLSPVVRGAMALPQRACGGSLSRLRAARGKGPFALRATWFNPCRGRRGEKAGLGNRHGE